jgi:hypothetical protein
MLNVLINNCNDVILRLDNFEELRPLHISEWNFRNIVKDRLQHLLLCKQDYWRKRCTARWARLGDENTSFFHSMATIKFWRNTIFSLTRDDGSVAVEHQEKAGLLWHSFKERIGVSLPISSTFNYAQYFTPLEGLGELSKTFTHDEIDQVVAQMPTDRSPGPDGFGVIPEGMLAGS